MCVSNIDVVHMYQYGWPVYGAGPMHYANTLGLNKVLEKRRYHQQAGNQFWVPSPYLEKLVA